jgi:hypothetical protein
LGVAGAAFGIVLGSAAPGVFALGLVEEPGIGEPGDVDCGVLLCVPVVLRPPVAPAPPAWPPPACATAHALHKKIVPVKTNNFCFIFGPSMLPLARTSSWMETRQAQMPSNRQNRRHLFVICRFLTYES